jgi:pyruvate kinase
MVRKACRIAFEEGLVKARDGLIIIAGIPLGSPGATNMVRIAFVDGHGAPIAEEI